MRTISYILKQNEDGSIEGIASLRGAVIYTGRMLLNKYSDVERLDRMFTYGPLDMVGLFPEEVEGIKNPPILIPAEEQQKNKIPEIFHSGSAKFETFQEFRKTIEKFKHYNNLDFYIFSKNKTWFYTKHTSSDFKKLTNHIIFADEEDYG